MGAGVFNIAYSGNFKTNEYVRVIKTNAGVSIIRLADALSLDAMVSELNYLKKANQTQEDTGTSEAVATTPKTNLTAFTRRVIGADSGDFLAIATGAGARNGLMSSADKAIINGLVNPVKNYGTISFDVGQTATTCPADGDFGTSASITGTAPDSIITVTMSNAMTGSGTNYYCRAFIQGQSSSLNNDNDICAPVFKPLNNTQFQISFREVTGKTQSLKVHIEVVQL